MYPFYDEARTSPTHTQHGTSRTVAEEHSNQNRIWCVIIGGHMVLWSILDFDCSGPSQ